MEWIPYSQFKDVKEIARGGFGIIYEAMWLNGSIINGANAQKLKRFRKDKIEGRRNNETVILKRFKDSQDISKYFLNEVNTVLLFILFI